MSCLARWNRVELVGGASRSDFIRPQTYFIRGCFRILMVRILSLTFDTSAVAHTRTHVSLLLFVRASFPLVGGVR